MSSTLTYSGTLTPTACWCGIHVAIPESLYRAALNNSQTVYCPLGHTFVWRETEADRLKAKLALAERRATNAAEREQALARQLAAAKGQQTKLRKRIAAGVCPCCQRSFENLARHMKGQHPEFAIETPEPVTA